MAKHHKYFDWCPHGTSNVLGCGLCIEFRKGADADPREFAFRMHGAQRYGDRPFIEHLDAVAKLVGDDPLLRTVAYLHDVVEDTQCTTEDLLDLFGQDVARAVNVMTDGPGSRAERKARSHRRLAELDPQVPWKRAALVVKVADRLANVQACLDAGDARFYMYREEHVAFTAAVHRDGLCDGLWEQLDQRICERPRPRR